jgi:hypothetical protein
MGRTKAFIFLASMFLVAAAGYVVWSVGQAKFSSAWDSMQLSSTDIPQTEATSQGASQAPLSELMLPQTFSCQGEDINPDLVVEDVPPDAASLAVDMVDTSGIFAGNQAHWLIWNISPDTLKIPANANNLVGVIGTNDAGKQLYSGPCQANDSAKHYRFEVYALDTILDLPQTANYNAYEKAISNHILGYGSLTVSYKRQTTSNTAK